MACGTAETAACPDGEATVFAGASRYETSSYPEQIVEGVLAGSTLGRYRVIGPEELLRPFSHQFVRTRGKAESSLAESEYWYPATIECFTPRCTTDGSGALELELTGRRPLSIRAGDDEAICSKKSAGVELSGLHWTTRVAEVELYVPELSADATAAAATTADVVVSLLDLHLDGLGKGEFHSFWSGTCTAEVASHEPIERADSGDRYAISGVVRSCELAPNQRGEAKSPAMLQELRFTSQYLRADE